MPSVLDRISALDRIAGEFGVAARLARQSPLLRLKPERPLSLSERFAAGEFDVLEKLKKRWRESPVAKILCPVEEPLSPTEQTIRRLREQLGLSSHFLSRFTTK